MMNLVSRCRVRDPIVLASAASESPGETKSESQNVPLSSLNVQQTSTVRPVLGASSSTYSEWNIDDKWSSQVWKSGDMSNTSTGRPVYDKFVLDDDMDFDTATESNLSLRSRSFLNRVNDRLRKILDHSSSDAMQDIDKSSLIWGMFMSSTLEASVFMVENYSENFNSIKNTGNNITLKRMFDISEKLILQQSDENFGVSQISGKIFHGNNYLWSMMKKSSICRMQRFMYSQILFHVWESESEPNIKYCFGTAVGLVH